MQISKDFPDEEWTQIWASVECCHMPESNLLWTTPAHCFPGELMGNSCDSVQSVLCVRVARRTGDGVVKVSCGYISDKNVMVSMEMKKDSNTLYQQEFSRFLSQSPLIDQLLFKEVATLNDTNEIESVSFDTIDL
ncbi:hypothetical protein CEXT_321681 [Caerostris extrusa]|uniref:Uncharacterized protein n=1 Tax=Caerostris extrusa TaxID=172846 RepID=A0AAV4XWR9_CAEEX|nr:hypothetical protein CEXT_321681 [Caerostris extrusa]